MRHFRDYCPPLVKGTTVAYYASVSGDINAGMAKTFRQALIDALERTGTPLKQVAEGAGVSYEQFKKLVQREDAATNVDDAVKVANFFGMTVDEFIEDRTAEARDAAADLWRQLSEAERDLLLAAARGRGAQGRVEVP